MNGSQNFVLFIGRLLMGALFVVAGVRKAFYAYAGTITYMANNGVPMAEPLLIATIIVEIGGGLALILGWKTRSIATVLAIFVAIITPIFHGFWKFPDAQWVGQLNHFLKNLAVIGGLLYMAALGAGGMSLDGERRGRR
jgi:putative oxidoreductase